MPPRLDFPAVELSFPASVDTGDRNCGRQQKAYQITGEASASVGGGGVLCPGRGRSESPCKRQMKRSQWK